MAPATSVARVRKQMFDRVERGEVTVLEACRQYRMSTSRFYELRQRYRAYGEAGLLPKPRPAAVPSRQASPALRDAVIGYAVEHPTHGPRTIAASLALPRYGRLDGVPRRGLQRAGPRPAQPHQHASGGR
jgi:hypothetical protein